MTNLISAGVENVAPTNGPLLRVNDLSIGFPGRDRSMKLIVQHVSFDLSAGESLAVVGESGSGKTMIGKALLGLLPDAARIVSGSARFDGQDLFDNSGGAWRAVRGTGIGMVFQEPMVSLNPAFRIGEQMIEALVRKRGMPRAKAWTQAVEMLERVRVRDPLGCMGRYPHEFSGGMRQRIMLASVMLLRPRLLIADEPTTALDCVVQKDVLDVMMNLTREEGTALVFISHNLALVAAYTEKVLVMRAGLAVETGPVTRVLSRPAHDYTLNLLDALPRRMPDKPSATEDAEATGKSTVLELRQLVIEYSVVGPWFSKRVTRVVHGVSLKVRAGETVAIVGESGSGKTSLTKAILGLLKLTDGDVLLQGKSYLHGGRENLRAARRSIQMIFQDPYSSLDPRMRVASLVGEALRSDTTLSAMERRARVVTSLEDVGLDGYAERFVHELSGGQRQRVAIARALASRPALIIADEPVSALDVTVQKQVLDMLTSLQARYGFGCLLISHDLGVVEQIADSVIVMLRGHIVEEGTRDALFDNPRHPYTQRLLQAVPELRGDRGNGFHVLTRTIPAADPEALIEYFNPELATGGLAHSSLVDVTPGGPFHRIALV